MAECSTCMNATEATRIAGDPVCRECLEARFQSAINEETDYPPSWGPGQELNIDDFTNLLPPDFIRRYKEREQMYSVPPNYRLFCAARAGRPDCGILLGDRRTFGAARPQPVQCEACQHSTCACGAPYLHGGHVCEADLGPEFHPSERAISWQQCPYPGCLMKALKNGGCNHMRCACGTHYCFLCGQEALGPDVMAHWRDGGCLAYGRPGAEEAAYFPEPDPDDEEDEGMAPFGIETDDDNATARLIELDRLAADMTMNLAFSRITRRRIVHRENNERLLDWQLRRSEIEGRHYTAQVHRIRTEIAELRMDLTTVETENRGWAWRAQVAFTRLSQLGVLSNPQLADIRAQVLRDTELMLI